MDWIFGTGGLVSGLLVAVLVAYATHLIRGANVFQGWMTGAWNSFIRPVNALAETAEHLWKAGVKSLRAPPKLPLLGNSPTTASFTSPLWMRVGTALIYLVCFFFLLVAEFRLGEFRMNALFGLSTDGGPGESVDRAAAFVLVASGVVWATFALEVFDLDIFGISKSNGHSGAAAAAVPAGGEEEGEENADNHGAPGASDQAAVKPVAVSKARRVAQVIAVVGLVCSALLACVSFYVGQQRADVFARQAFELEQDLLDQQTAAEANRQAEAAVQAQNQARQLCELAGGTDCGPIAVREPAAPPERVRPEFEPSGFAVQVSQVLLAFSLFGALAIAGAGLVPTLALAARLVYLLLQAVLAPLIVLAFAVDMAMRLLSGSMHVVAGTGAAVFDGTATLGEMSANGVKAVGHGVGTGAKAVGKSIVNLNEQRRARRGWPPADPTERMTGPAGPSAAESSVHGFDEAVRRIQSGGSRS